MHLPGDRGKREKRGEEGKGGGGARVGGGMSLCATD